MESCEVAEADERRPYDINVGFYGLNTTKDNSVSNGSPTKENENIEDMNHEFDNIFACVQEEKPERKCTAQFGGEMNA